MVSKRLEIRLDPERRCKLQELSEEQQIAASELVRRLIDQAYEQRERARRLAIVDRLREANLEDAPDPDELSRQLAKTYDNPDHYQHQRLHLFCRQQTPAARP